MYICTYVCTSKPFYFSSHMLSVVCTPFETRNMSCLKGHPQYDRSFIGSAGPIKLCMGHCIIKVSLFWGGPQGRTHCTLPERVSAICMYLTITRMYMHMCVLLSASSNWDSRCLLSWHCTDYIHTCIHTYVRTHIHTYIHTYIRTSLPEVAGISVTQCPTSWH